MSCPDADTLVTLSSALGPEWEARVRHIADCPSCRATIGDLTVIGEALRPHDLQDEELDRIERGLGLVIRKERWLGRRGPVLAPVALFLVCSMATFYALYIALAGVGPQLSQSILLSLAVLTGLGVTARAVVSERARPSETPFS